MCVYLLKMREYYRWEQQQYFTDELSAKKIGAWLGHREELWETLEHKEYQPLSIRSDNFDPFESDKINRILVPEGLIYSGGYGVKSKPHFFLAHLEQHRQYNGYNIYISGREYARDLSSPPAMSHNQTIYIRRESFKRLLWERIEEWRWNQPKNAMARAIACYHFDDDQNMALDAMTNNEIQATILHEIGEIQAGKMLPGWQAMMNDISFTPAEIMARAVRDHLADTLHTLPELLGNQTTSENQQASIHFYFANLTAMRKHIYPSLMSAYQQWCKNDNIDLLHKNISTGKEHWQKLASEILALYLDNKEHCSKEIETLIQSCHLQAT